MKHLTPDQLIDALENAPSADAGRHLSDCADCREQLSMAALALKATSDAEIPEPSPLFWEHFSTRVRAAVDVEETPTRQWPQWFRLPVLAPIAALAMVIAVLAITLPRSPGPLPLAIAESTSSDILLSDDGWTLVADAVGDLDWETATEAGLTVEPGAVDRVVMDLNLDEQRALTALLQDALRTKS
jgi:hypothetical protein